MLKIFLNRYVFHSADCNGHADDITPYISDASLSPICYMTLTSSVVELTCPPGQIFESNNSSRLVIECVCGGNTGYASVSVNCVGMYMV